MYPKNGIVSAQISAHFDSSDSFLVDSILILGYSYIFYFFSLKNTIPLLGISYYNMAAL